MFGTISSLAGDNSYNISHRYQHYVQMEGYPYKYIGEITGTCEMEFVYMGDVTNRYKYTFDRETCESNLEYEPNTIPLNVGYFKCMSKSLTT